MGIWLVIPAVIAAVLAMGSVVCIGLGWDPHWREMLFAATTCLVAGELALIPMRLTRGATQIAVSQAALVATMIHLFASTGLGGSLILMKSLEIGSAFVYWLLALYWTTLIALVVILVREVKHAPSTTPNLTKPQ
jgi:hypothetical protein